MMDVVHEMPLLSTLAIGLTTAFVCGMVAAKLRLSPIVGYLLAGVLVGPFTPGIEADTDIASELAEIGIVLLMFGVGLHFSIHDLLKVRKIALPGAVGQILISIAMGAGIAYLWEWPLERGLLMGLALSVASTVVLLRALEQHNILYSENGRIAVGWLIVEDLAMVLALVLIPALASGVTGSAGVSAGIWGWLTSLSLALGKITLFILCMLVIGKRVLPWLLRLVAQTRSRELFTLAVFAVAIGIAFGAAELFGVSFALGAFFAGMMIKESDLSHEAAEKALPFQDAFAVLFFVAVGMLFDPQILLSKPLQLLSVVLIIIVGKSLAAFIIVLLFRYSLRTALLVSASLAQIGEFSFILAALGMQYGLLGQDENSLILAGALISISLNPLAFHGINAAHSFIASRAMLAKYLNITEDQLSRIPAEQSAAINSPVILVGYGHVGRKVHALLGDTETIILDLNRERVERLRESGIPAMVADAGSPDVLKAAKIESATGIAITVRSAYEAQRIMTAARKLRPDLKVLVRAENYHDFLHFDAQNVSLAVMGKWEAARRMAEYIRGEIFSNKHVM